jgi:hypothetical protein
MVAKKRRNDAAPDGIRFMNSEFVRSFVSTPFFIRDAHRMPVTRFFIYTNTSTIAKGLIVRRVSSALLCLLSPLLSF